MELLRQLLGRQIRSPQTWIVTFTELLTLGPASIQDYVLQHNVKKQKTHYYHLKLKNEISVIDGELFRNSFTTHLQRLKSHRLSQMPMGDNVLWKKLTWGLNGGLPFDATLIQGCPTLLSKDPHCFSRLRSSSSAFCFIARSSRPLK